MRDPKRTLTTGLVLTFLISLAAIDRGSLEHSNQNGRSRADSQLAAQIGAELQSVTTGGIAQDDSAVRLTGTKTEDDYLALAVGTQGRVWLAYVEYQTGSPIVLEQVHNRQFDSLVTNGHGDRVYLRRFDGRIWYPLISDSRRRCPRDFLASSDP